MPFLDVDREARLRKAKHLNDAAQGFYGAAVLAAIIGYAIAQRIPWVWVLGAAAIGLLLSGWSDWIQAQVAKQQEADADAFLRR